MSLISNTGNINDIKGIFDTQIAHRMCYEDENNCNSIGTKHNSISLNELLKNNFNVNFNIKDEVHDMMSNSPYLWKTRPIPYKLNYYAGCDVYYLPKIYELICQKIEKKIVKSITIMDIFNECKKYLKYLSINSNIKNYNRMNLSKGTKIKGLIKNFQQYCVFVQLNIGYIGIVNLYKSVQILEEKYKLGDIIDFVIIDIDNKKKKLLLNIPNIEDEQNLKIDNYINENTIIDENMQNNTINSNILLSGVNIEKESFYPKSYIQNLKNGVDMNSFNNQGQNFFYFGQNYYPKNNNLQNELLNSDILNNNNYNKLFYNDKEKYYRKRHYKPLSK